ncbi:hypothetical protein GPALN_016352 [Globodera pallida]|nr:hypothetical protein GPALN_016352 [Globodera pallida]
MASTKNCGFSSTGNTVRANRPNLCAKGPICRQMAEMYRFTTWLVRFGVTLFFQHFQYLFAFIFSFAFLKLKKTILII